MLAKINIKTFLLALKFMAHLLPLTRILALLNRNFILSMKHNEAAHGISASRIMRASMSEEAFGNVTRITVGTW